jgi:hypothetical protein
VKKKEKSQEDKDKEMETKKTLQTNKGPITISKSKQLQNIEVGQGSKIGKRENQSMVDR